MSPLALIPIGLCAFIATFSAESAIKNQLGNSFKPTSKVMLKESFTPFEVQQSIMARLSNMPTPASSAEYSDLVVRVAITKMLHIKLDQKEYKPVQKSNAIETSKASEEPPDNTLQKRNRR